MASHHVITIDGPAGSGKSTISRAVAARLGYAYLDTGAMYRAVGLQAVRTGIDPDNEEQMRTLLDTMDLQLLPADGDTRVILDHRDVSLDIRTPAMGMMASRVSALAIVRRKLTDLQQRLGGQGPVVAEGRDMGTVVFPLARYKFYLDATPEERSRRRTAQLQEQGVAADYNEILAQTKQRDHDDSTRALAPLKPANDAICIDSSHMTIPEVIESIVATVQGRNHGAA